MELSSGPAEKYADLTNLKKYRESLSATRRRSFRVNALKASVENVAASLESEWSLEQIPWCNEGFWISRKEGGANGIGNLPEHETGLFYVQEAASMIPALVLDPRPGKRVLDMCASPGGKTTQLAALMKNEGEIVANDIREDRIAILKRNVERMGVANVTITQKPGQQFKDEKFDRILVDAPCSGTGTMRTEEDFTSWDPEVFKRISFEQKSLLHTAYCVLKRGGVLVYSTCSMEPEENEVVVDWLLKRHRKTRLEEIELAGLNRSEPVAEYGGIKVDESVSKCLRLWPQDNGTDGFFVAKMRKT